MKRCEQCDAKDVITLRGLRTRRTVVGAAVASLTYLLIMSLGFQFHLLPRLHHQDTIGPYLPMLLFGSFCLGLYMYIMMRTVKRYPHAENKARLVLGAVTRFLAVAALGFLVLVVGLAQLLS